MSGYLLTDLAHRHLNDIYDYTEQVWGTAQAELYVGQLFDLFAELNKKHASRRIIPDELGFRGYYRLCQHHYIYWRTLNTGEAEIVAILHARMHQAARLQELREN